MSADLSSKSLKKAALQQTGPTGCRRTPLSDRINEPSLKLSGLTTQSKFLPAPLTLHADLSFGHSQRESEHSSLAKNGSL